GPAFCEALLEEWDGAGEFTGIAVALGQAVEAAHGDGVLLPQFRSACLQAPLEQLHRMVAPAPGLVNVGQANHARQRVRMGVAEAGASEAEARLEQLDRFGLLAHAPTGL